MTNFPKRVPNLSEFATYIFTFALSKKTGDL